MNKLALRTPFLLAACFVTVLGAQAGRARVLYAFKGGADGAIPAGGLVGDDQGNLFGTTAQGGQAGCDGVGCGTVFELHPDGTKVLLHTFQGGSDGATPVAPLIRDSGGNLYGTTPNGGGTGTGCNGYGCGTVFKIAPDGTETVLYAFTGGSDGAFPNAALYLDSGGNLYGTAAQGGVKSRDCASGTCGTIFKIAPDGSETTLYAFCSQPGCADGYFPMSNLLMDRKGNLYGTTIGGGDRGGGTIFRLASDGVETVTYSFKGRPDGADPGGNLIRDRAGNIYGTTNGGGAYQFGTIFELSYTGAETIIHSFSLEMDGADPASGVVMDKAGNFYGTTLSSGYVDCNNDGNKGSVFKVTPNDNETVHCVTGVLNAGVIIANDMLYSAAMTTIKHSDGTVFALKK